MDKLEFCNSINRLLLAYRKSMDEDTLNLWFEECQVFELWHIRKAVSEIINDKKIKYFPRIAEFKDVAYHYVPDPSKSKGKLTSCSRCNQGVCSVRRVIGASPYYFTYRCSCESGRHWSYPDIDPFMRTVKEESAHVPNSIPETFHDDQIPSERIPF